MRNDPQASASINVAISIKKSERRFPPGPKPATGNYRSEQHQDFSAALRHQMLKHGDTIPSLIKAIEPNNSKRRSRTIKAWRLGISLPTHLSSFSLLQKIEWRYGLQEGYFAEIAQKRNTTAQLAIKQINVCDQAAFKWHLPSNFDRLSKEEQQDVLAWIDRNVLPCNTDYGKYQSVRSQSRYAVVFPTLPIGLGGRYARGGYVRDSKNHFGSGGFGTVEASSRLTGEMTDLIAFMTAPLPPRGHARARPWSKAAADLQARRYGELLGALLASPHSSAVGLGISKEKLTLGLLVFPKVWDWYLRWREKRRGFYAVSERSMMYSAKALLRYSTGWLRQRPKLARSLRPIKGLVTEKDIRIARKNWPAQCDLAFRYAYERARQLHWIIKPVRDPILPIVSVLNSEEPLKLYRRVGDEILKRMPDGRIDPVSAAVAVRNYIMFRFAIHLGFRQRNLRELLLSEKQQKPRSTHQLQQLRRGELRWSNENRSWEVFMPAAAFKNCNSSYFRSKPYSQVLPRVGKLYRWIDIYLTDSRPRLLGEFADPGTLFVKETRAEMRVAEFELHSFYDAWMLMIQRYGIYNPYTKRGAIKGLLPHGPHCVRDILATHILKTTGSYELAGFAIQDTPEATMRHYARFLPHEKAARAAEIVNTIWSG